MSHASIKKLIFTMILFLIRFDIENVLSRNSVAFSRKWFELAVLCSAVGIRVIVRPCDPAV